MSRVTSSSACRTADPATERESRRSDRGGDLRADRGHEPAVEPVGLVVARVGRAAQLFAPDAVLEDLTLRTAVVGRPVDRGLPRASLALTPLRPGRTGAPRRRRSGRRRLRVDEPGRLGPARRQRDQAQFPGTDRAADFDLGRLAGHTSMDHPAHVGHDRELEPRPEPGLSRRPSEPRSRARASRHQRR